MIIQDTIHQKNHFQHFTLTGIMQRKNPIYLTTIVGKPILEDAYIGKVIESAFLPMIRMFHPEVVDFEYASSWMVSRYWQ